MAYGDDLRRAVDKAIEDFIKGRLAQQTTLPIDWFATIEKIREVAYGSINWASIFKIDPGESEEVRRERFHDAVVNRAVAYTNQELENMLKVTKLEPEEKYVVEPDSILGKAINSAATRAAGGTIDKTHRHRVNFVASVLDIRDEVFEEVMVKLEPCDHQVVHTALTEVVSETLGLLDRDYMLTLNDNKSTDGNIAGNLKTTFDSVFDDINS